jgi:hypothetical protein
MYSLSLNSTGLLSVFIHRSFLSLLDAYGGAVAARFATGVRQASMWLLKKANTKDFQRFSGTCSC